MLSQIGVFISFLEICIGRLVMVASICMIAQIGFLGTTGPAMRIPGAALPQRAFEGELGVIMPFKYWDPLDLAGYSEERPSSVGVRL